MSILLPHNFTTEHPGDFSTIAQNQVTWSRHQTVHPSVPTLRTSYTSYPHYTSAVSPHFKQSIAPRHIFILNWFCKLFSGDKWTKKWRIEEWNVATCLVSRVQTFSASHLACVRLWPASVALNYTEKRITFIVDARLGNVSLLAGEGREAGGNVGAGWHFDRVGCCHQAETMLGGQHGQCSGVIQFWHRCETMLTNIQKMRLKQ